MGNWHLHTYRERLYTFPLLVYPLQSISRRAVFVALAWCFFLLPSASSSVVMVSIARASQVPYSMQVFQYGRYIFTPMWMGLVGSMAAGASESPWF